MENITYTGWPILIHPVEYLENQARKRKMFQTKVVWFRGGHKFDLEESFEGHVKVTSIFLNGTPSIFLHILVAHLESFPKCYY